MNILSSGKSNKEKYTRLLHISEFIKKYTLNNFLPFQNDLIKSQSDMGLKFEIRVRETMSKLNKTD